MQKKRMFQGAIACLFILGLSASAFAFGLGTDKFKDESTKEQEAVKLTREVQQGGYGIVNAEELKGMIATGKEMFIQKKSYSRRKTVSFSHSGDERMGHQGNQR